MKKTLRNIPSQFRWTAFTTVVVLILLLCIFMVAGCSSDDSDADYLPPLTQELCEIITDNTGVATVMRYADGRECPLVAKVNDLTPDSTYRISAAILETESGVTLYNAHMVLSPMPVVRKLGEIKTDPVDVIACWRDCRYINLRLSVKRSYDVNHFMGFSDYGLRHNPNGTTTYTACLYHDANADADHFRQEIIVSCPIYPMADRLRLGTDSVCLKVNTPDGFASYTMLY